MKLKSQQDSQNFTKKSPLIDMEMEKKFPLIQDATNQTLKCSCQVLEKTNTKQKQKNTPTFSSYSWRKGVFSSSHKLIKIEMDEFSINVHTSKAGHIFLDVSGPLA